MRSELEKELIHINRQLIRLKLQQDRLEAMLIEVQRQIEQDSQEQIATKGVIHYQIVPGNKTKKETSNREKLNPRPPYGAVTISGEKAYDETKVPEIGDYVRIVKLKNWTTK